MNYTECIANEIHRETSIMKHGKVGSGTKVHLIVDFTYNNVRTVTALCGTGATPKWGSNKVAQVRITDQHVTCERCLEMQKEKGAA